MDRRNFHFRFLFRFFFCSCLLFFVSYLQWQTEVTRSEEAVSGGGGDAVGRDICSPLSLPVPLVTSFVNGGGEWSGDFSKLSTIVISGFASDLLRACSVLDCSHSPLDFNPLDVVRLNSTKERGFEVSEESSKDQATTNNYTDFLHATSLGKAEGEKVSSSLATPFEKTKIAAYTLGAIAPCMRFYASICHEILCHLNPDDENNTIYKKWIDNYCSQNLQESGLQTENLLDWLSITLTGEEPKVIDKLYHQALKLQVEFFSAQPLVQKTIVPLSRGQGSLFILSDFDLTCTKFDSSTSLAELALVTAPEIQSDRAEGQAQLARMPSSELKKTWDFLSTQYAEEYTQCIEKMLLNDKVESFSYEKLCEALKLLEDFEKAARVVETGVLKGLHVDGIKHVGRNLVLQDGFKGFFAKVVKNEDLKPNVRVLSYCWSWDLIRSAFSSGNLDGIKVHSNELVYEDSISTGEMINEVESPIEKLQLFNDTVKKCCDNHRTVYIGGSVGDLHWNFRDCHMPKPHSIFASITEAAETNFSSRKCGLTTPLSFSAIEIADGTFFKATEDYDADSQRLLCQLHKSYIGDPASNPFTSCDRQPMKNIFCIYGIDSRTEAGYYYIRPSGKQNWIITDIHSVVKPGGSLFSRFGKLVDGKPGAAASGDDPVGYFGPNGKPCPEWITDVIYEFEGSLLFSRSRKLVDGKPGAASGDDPVSSRIQHTTMLTISTTHRRDGSLMYRWSTFMKQIYLLP